MNEYDTFDFNWVPQAWEYDALHCFSTGPQEYGDTFFVNRKTFLAQAEIEKLKPEIKPETQDGDRTRGSDRDRQGIQAIEE